MKKKIISAFLALVLIVAMALPASAFSVSAPRYWNGVYYATNDTCYTRSFRCVIESDSTAQTLRADVLVVDSNENAIYYGGWSSTLYVATYDSVDNDIHHIISHHYIGGDLASTQKVYPG